jgi:hypothetical protein
MYAVIRTDHDALHFIGKLDAYNVESLREHARAMRRDRDAVEAWISVDPAERRGLGSIADRWFAGFEADGVRVQLAPPTSAPPLEFLPTPSRGAERPGHPRARASNGRNSAPRNNVLVSVDSAPTLPSTRP